MVDHESTRRPLRRLSNAARKRLREPLDPALISERVTEHGEVLRYLEGWRAIAQANAVFGPDRWGAELVSEPTYRQLPGRGGDPPSGFYTAGVRITVDGCRDHSDIGTAVVGEQTAEAHAVACKAAVTDALKRALRHFGAAFGNELSHPLDPPAATDVAPEELRQRVLDLAARGGTDAAGTREWVAARYECTLDELDGEPLEDAVSVLAAALGRRNGHVPAA